MRHELDKRLDNGVPQPGLRGRDGRFFEDLKFVPDIPIAAEPAALTAGRDPQLKCGVEVLMKKIGRVRSAAGPCRAALDDFIRPLMLDQPGVSCQ